MKGPMLIALLFLVTVISFKPQNAPVNIKSDKPAIKADDLVIIKKQDSIQKSVDTRLEKTEPIVDINSKLKEDNIALKKLENKLTNEVIDALIKERKDLVYKNQSLYIPEKSFKSMAVEYKGEIFYIVKDSTCTNYNRPLFSKKKCTQYDYYLKINK